MRVKKKKKASPFSAWPYHGCFGRDKSQGPEHLF